MQAKRSDPAVAERAVALQVLRNDHPERWSRSELERAIPDIEPVMIDEALEHLAAAGVVVLDGESVRASGCARHLDALGLIAV
jgi:DNA-binding HxlR family transcriptional regulator